MKITQVEAIQLRLPAVNERYDGSQDRLVGKVGSSSEVGGSSETIWLLCL